MFRTLREAIKHSKETKETTLDLNRLGLTGTEPELEELKDFDWVEELILVGYEGLDASIYHLDRFNLFDEDYEKYIMTRHIDYKYKLLQKLPQNLKKLVVIGSRYMSSNDILALHGLKKLTHLIFSNNQIIDISVLSYLPNLTHIDFSNNQITDISVLSSLPNLTELNFSSNQITDISALSSLPNLTELNFSSNQITDISALSSLPNLKILNFSNNQITKISALSSLPNLTELNFSNNQITDISVLSSLPNLTELNFSSNQITKIFALSSLPNLKILNFSNNQITDISVLSSLPNLTELNFSSNQIKDISVLSSLPNLTKLHFSNNKITDISPLKNLTNLINIDFSNNQISTNGSFESYIQAIRVILNIIQDKDIKDILTKLLDICLSKKEFRYTNSIFNKKQKEIIVTNRKIAEYILKKGDFYFFVKKIFQYIISEIKNELFVKYIKEDLFNLINIKEIILSENNIYDISFLQKSHLLENINISRNMVEDVRPLMRLKNLKIIDFNSCNVENFPYSLFYYLPNLQGIKIHNNSLRNIPSELNTDKATLAELRAYCEAQLQGNIINNICKIVWFGNGEVGKTTLSHQFREGAFSAEVGEDRTHGILLHDWRIAFADLPAQMQQKMKDASAQYTAPLPDSIVLKSWDFGGQEYYHATHRLFLTNNVLYLLVWDSATNRQDDNEGIYPLAYWRDNISHYTDSNVIVIEIQNKVQGACQINHENLQYKVHYRTENQRDITKYDLDIDELKEAIFSQLANLSYLGQSFPKVYDDLRKLLPTLGEPYLLLDKYRQVCEQNDFTADKIMRKEEQIQTLTNFLHETGELICYSYKPKAPEILKRYVFLQPEWVTGYIYRILARPLQEVGEFDQAHITLTTQDSGIEAEVWVSLMQEFELIFENKSKNTYIAPQYLPTQCTKEQALALTWAVKASKPALMFEVHYPTFLPKSLFSRFVARYGTLHVDNLYWKNGLLFTLRDKVVYATCDYPNRKIRIEIQDQDAQVAWDVCMTLRDIDNTPQLEISPDGVDFVRYEEINHSNPQTRVTNKENVWIDTNRLAFLNRTKRSENVIGDLESFKAGLIDLCDKLLYHDIFNKIDKCNFEYDKSKLNTLKDLHISPNPPFDLAQKVKTFITTLY